MNREEVIITVQRLMETVEKLSKLENSPYTKNTIKHHNEILNYMRENLK